MQSILSPLSLLSMDTLFQSIRDNSEWLYSIVFKYKWFYYDLWSLVNLWSGGIIFAILTAYKVKRKWIILLLVLAIPKLIDAAFSITIFDFFKPERSINILNDLVIGVLGGYLMHIYFHWKVTKNHPKWLALFISSITIAFIWVGTYRYNYSIPFFNSPFINWWALTAWTVSGMIIIFVSSFIKTKINYFFGVAIPWLIYLILLFAVEYIAYHLLSFREMSKGTTPLVFDIIHGTRIMHIYYTTAPLYFIGLFFWLSYLFKKIKLATSSEAKLHPVL